MKQKTVKLLTEYGQQQAARVLDAMTNTQFDNCLSLFAKQFPTQTTQLKSTEFLAEIFSAFKLPAHYSNAVDKIQKIRSNKPVVEKQRANFIKALGKLIETEYPEYQGLFDDIRANKELYVIPSTEVNGTFTYTKQGNHCYDLETRQRSKFPRIIQRNFPDAQIPDHILGEISNKLIANIWKLEVTIKCFTGDDIVIQYRKYFGNSSLRSCMTGSSADYVELYAVNPEKVALYVIYDKHNLAQARVIVWTGDDNKRYLYNPYYDEYKFSTYLAEELKQEGVSDILPDDLTVTLNDPTTYYPYVDGLNKAKKPTDDTIVLAYQRDSSYVYTLDSEYGKLHDS